MGVFDFIGDAIGGITDIALDIVSPVTNAFGLDLRDTLNSFGKQMSGQNAIEMNRENIAMQRETNEMQRQMHSQDMQLSRDLQADAQRFNAAEAEKARQFNSAGAQMQRLSEAGINPFAAAQAVSGAQANASGASASSPVASTPATPSLTSPRNDISTATLPLNNMLAAFGMVSRVIESLGGAKRNRAEAKDILTKLEPTVELIKNQTIESSIKQTAGKLQNNILAATGMMKANQEVKNMVQEYAESVARCNYLALEGETEKAQKNLIELQQIGQRLQNVATSKQNKYLEPILQRNIKELDSRIRSIDADTGLTIAQRKTEDATRNAKVANLNADTYYKIQSGNLNNEQAQTIREQRPLVLRWQELLNDGKVIENSKLEQRLTNEIELQTKELERCGLINQQELQRLEMLKKENKLYYVKEAVNMVTAIGDTAAKFMPYRFPFLSSSTSTNTSTYSGTTKNENYTDVVTYERPNDARIYHNTRTRPTGAHQYKYK